MTTNTSQSEGAILISDLLQKCHALLDELNQFCAFLVDRKKEHAVEIKPFRNSVLSELRSLEKVRFYTPSSQAPLPPLTPKDMSALLIPPPAAVDCRPNYRPNYPYSPLLQSTILHRRLDRRKTKPRSCYLLQTLLLVSSPEPKIPHQETLRPSRYCRP